MTEWDYSKTGIWSLSNTNGKDTMKEKKKCNTCKKKTGNKVKTLQTYDKELLLEAGQYLQRITEMTPEKWDIVEDIYLQIYPTGNRLNRQCGDCLRNVTKAVLYEYNKITK